MAYEKILVLESNWAEGDEDYIADSRSTTRIYSAVETLLSLREDPVFVLQRPLLASRYLVDIEQFIRLKANSKGPNFIILSGHGEHEFVKKTNGDQAHRRIIHAIDGKINISTDLRKLNQKLKRTIFILDACSTGQKIESFRAATGALGAIGFSNDVSWVDSACFLLAFLLKCQEDGVFQLKRARRERPKEILESMSTTTYKSIAKSLGLQYSFNEG